MATKLGDVSVQVKLDTSEAERQIEAIRKKVSGISSGSSTVSTIPGAPWTMGAKTTGGHRSNRRALPAHVIHSGMSVPSTPRRDSRSVARAATTQGVAEAAETGAGQIGPAGPQGPPGRSYRNGLQHGYTVWSIMQGIQTPLDFAQSAANAIPVVGGGIAFGMQAARLAGTVGAPVAKGIIEGQMASGQIPEAAQKIIKETILNNLDSLAKAMAKTEAFNESIKPAIEKMIQIAGVSSIATKGQAIPVGTMTDIGIMAFQEEYQVNAANRRFRQWRLEMGGESLGASIAQVMGQSFKASSAK